MAGARLTGGPGSFLANAIAVFAYTLSTTGHAISMAALIFAGPLAVGLPRAVAAFCLAGGLLSIYIALRSQLSPSGSVIQDGPVIVLVAVAAGVGTRGAQTSVADVFVLLALTSAATAAIMWLLGRFRLGGLVRYIPTTVIAAFMAGTGWLLVKGGLDVMVGSGVGLDDLTGLIGGDVAKFWLPGFAVGATAWLIGRSDRVPVIAIGATIVASLTVFYVVVLSVSTVGDVEAAGWLIGPFPEGSGVGLVSPQELADANWSHIFAESAGVISVVAVAVIVLLLNLTGLALTSTERLDVDKELRTVSGANLLMSPFGCAPGFHGLGSSLLLKRMGATSRLVPAIGGGLLAAFGIFGVGLIGLVPRFVVGALLITVGSALLEDWIKLLIHSVGRVERLMSVGIVLVIGSVGILEGIGAGLVAACVVFIVRYSRVDPIRSGGTAPALRSRVDRTPDQVAALGSRSDRLAVFELQGYLFFGSLTKLDERFQHADLATELDAVVLDFETVTGIDSSGYELISQLAEQLARRGALVVVSSLEGSLRTSLAATVPALDDQVVWVPTLDHALELAENNQLKRSGTTSADADERSLALSSDLLAEFEEVSFGAGEIVVEQGAKSDGMLIISSGVLTASRLDRNKKSHRLRRFGSHALVGEIGLITGGTRTAQVFAETDVAALWLSSVRYDSLRASDPELIFELHEYIMRAQAARVVSLSEGLTRSGL